MSSLVTNPSMISSKKSPAGAGGFVGQPRAVRPSRRSTRLPSRPAPSTFAAVSAPTLRGTFRHVVRRVRIGIVARDDGEHENEREQDCTHSRNLNRDHWCPI